jgi:hypothetical protein
MMGPTETHNAIWEGTSLQITWSPRWFESKRVDYAIAHLEVQSDPREPLPITETGYRSHFLPRETVEAYGGPVEYTLAWLRHEADTPAWRQYRREQQKLLEEQRQLSLF